MDNEYNKWALLNKIYEAKRKYYHNGKSTITDQEYDALRGSFASTYGQKLLAIWNCAKYDGKIHCIIRDNMAQTMKSI